MATVLLGQVGPGVAGANSNTNGVAFAQRYVALATGTVTSLNLRTGATGPTAGNLHAALYLDNGGNLTGATRLTADITGTFVANGITSFAVTPGVAVTLGTVYWIEWLGTGATTTYTNFAASGGTELDSAATTCPNPHGTQGGGNTNIANVWAEGDLPSAATSFFSPLLSMLNRGGLQRAQALLQIHPLPAVAAAAGPLNLDASGGTATASGSAPALSFTYAPGSGAATAGGSNVVFSDGLTAASGAATAGGGSYTLTFVYGVSGGNATAGGGSVTETTDTNVSVTGGLATAGGGAVTVAFTYSAAGGAATAGGGTDTGAFTFSATSGAATAGGGSDALTFVFGVAGGGATAGGGSVTESATTGADVSASGGAAAAAGGAVSFAVTLTAGAGGAQASGGTVSVSVDVTPPVVVEPPSVGPTGGADFDFGDESAIYGTSARVVSTRGRGHGWGSVARVRVSSAPPRLRIRLPRPRPVVGGVGAGRVGARCRRGLRGAGELEQHGARGVGQGCG
jgi:hypothetical protein